MANRLFELRLLLKTLLRLTIYADCAENRDHYSSNNTRYSLATIYYSPGCSNRAYTHTIYASYEKCHYAFVSEFHRHNARGFSFSSSLTRIISWALSLQCRLLREKLVAHLQNWMNVGPISEHQAASLLTAKMIDWMPLCVVTSFGWVARKERLHSRNTLR